LNLDNEVSNLEQMLIKLCDTFKAVKKASPNVCLVDDTGTPLSGHGAILAEVILGLNGPDLVFFPLNILPVPFAVDDDYENREKT